jgi:branched-subunit amino acid transport protein
MSSDEIVIILGMTAVTFGVRYPVLAAFGRIPLPTGILRGLRFVPPAVLAAIIVPAMFMPNGSQLFISIENAYLVAGLFAILVAWKSKNLLATIVLGMLAFWIWRVALGFLS